MAYDSLVFSMINVNAASFRRSRDIASERHCLMNPCYNYRINTSHEFGEVSDCYSHNSPWHIRMPNRFNWTIGRQCNITQRFIAETVSERRSLEFL